ncbi:mitochondrial K+-H+ exchange-related-domain-containing protein [Spinellus fusiger]|nr:mitochondrial K+-H+ exchange-related-domain-containing protein [Spinellus fusiger]
MRIFVIPILRNRWAYYCHSTLPTTSRLTKAIDWSGNKWEQLGEAKPDTWKRKLYTRGTSIMNQLDYQEWFLKSVPIKEHLERPLGVAKVIYPPSLSNVKIQDHLELLLKERVLYHKKYIYYSAYWVPLSCTFVVVPLIPNIPLFYNLFRLYSHYKAYKGAQHLQFLSYHDCLQYTESPEINSFIETGSLSSSHDIDFPLEQSDILEATPSRDTLDRLHKNIKGAIDLETIDKISQEFNIPLLETEIKRARYQILCEVAKNRFKLERRKEK